MTKATAIQIIEIDEAIYQLSLLLAQDFWVKGATFEYVNNRINELKTTKQLIYDISNRL